MKVKILRQVMISGEPVSAGSILELEHRDASTLIGLGKAVETKEEKKAPAAKPVAEEKPSEEEAPKPTTRKRTKQ